MIEKRLLRISLIISLYISYIKHQDNAIHFLETFVNMRDNAQHPEETDEMIKVSTLNIYRSIDLNLFNPCTVVIGLHDVVEK